VLLLLLLLLGGVAACMCVVSCCLCDRLHVSPCTRCCFKRPFCREARDQLEQVWVVLLKEGSDVMQPLGLRHPQQLCSGGSSCHCRGILSRHTCCRQLLLLLLLLLVLLLLQLPGRVLPMHC
jgi:hypothetical protein